MSNTPERPDAPEPRAEPPVGEVEAALAGMMGDWLRFTHDGTITMPVETAIASVRAALRRVSASPATTGSAEVYPNSDRGLLAMTARWADMTKDARLGTLRGIQEAAFRAGRADALLASTASAQQRPTRSDSDE
jgi:hypothetical protein